MPHPLIPAIRARIAELRQTAENLKTQDNLMTADPLYCVQTRERFYGLATNDANNITWLYADEGDEVPDEVFEELEKYYDDGEPEPDGYIRTAYVDRWEFVTGCLTMEAANSYIECNRHNMTDPRVYVETMYRNREMILIRESFGAMVQALAEKVNFHESLHTDALEWKDGGDPDLVFQGYDQEGEQDTAIRQLASDLGVEGE